jgi:hypothetical protein
MRANDDDFIDGILLWVPNLRQLLDNAPLARTIKWTVAQAPKNIVDPYRHDDCHGLERGCALQPMMVRLALWLQVQTSYATLLQPKTVEASRSHQRRS